MSIHNLTSGRIGSRVPHNADRFILLASIVLGAVGIVVLKINFYTPPSWIDQHVLNIPISTLSSPLWAIFVLVIYAILVRWTSSSQIEPETVGDNCYYLGFLFTLISLAVTLYQLGPSSLQTNIILPQIISGFGVALSSTIAGIALRLWFFQQRTDIVARDRENQLEVQRAVKEFRDALSTSTSSLKRFTTESVQLTIERDTKIRESTDSFLKQQSTQFLKLVEELEEVIKKQQNMLLSNADIFTKTIKDSMAKGFTDVIGEINETHIKGTQRALNELDNTVQKLVAGFDNLHEKNLNIITDIQEKTSGSFMLIDKAMAEIEKSVQKMPGLLDKFQESNQNIVSEIQEKAAGSLRVLEETTSELGDSVIKLSGGVDKFHKSNLKEISEIQDKTLDSFKVLDTTLVELEGTVKKLTGGIDEFNTKNFNVISDIQAKATSSFEDLDNTTKLFINSTAQSTEKLQKIVEDLIQNYQSSVTELGKNLDVNSENFEQIVSRAFSNGFARAADDISNKLNIGIKPTISDLENSAKKLAGTIEKFNDAIKTNNQTTELAKNISTTSQSQETRDNSGMFSFLRR